MCQNGIVVKDHLLEVNLHLSGVNLNIIDVKVNAALVNRKGTKMMDASTNVRRAAHQIGEIAA